MGKATIDCSDRDSSQSDYSKHEYSKNEYAKNEYAKSEAIVRRSEIISHGREHFTLPSVKSSGILLYPGKVCLDHRTAVYSALTFMRGTCIR